MKNKPQPTFSLLPVCDVLASPINKNEFVMGLSRKIFQIQLTAASY
jgi:hypothetical protein